MYCVQCQSHLSECTCPDLEERLGSLVNHPNIYIAPKALEQYKEAAERNKWPDTLDDKETTDES